MALTDYLHPLFGGAVVALWLFSGSLGLRALNAAPRRRAELLRCHRRFASVGAACVVLGYVSGLMAVAAGRPDLELASTPHFRLGSALTVVVAIQWLSAQRMDVRWLRALHPWMGAVTLLMAVAQVFFGLQLTR